MKKEKHKLESTPGYAQASSNARAKKLSLLDEQRLHAWQAIVKTVPPSFRHYFTESNSIPSLWFAMRLNYVRSVATSAIIGHVLGLGDRHPSNILLDKSSGELVPIDLGIAFDQVGLDFLTVAQIPDINFRGSCCPYQRLYHSV